MNILIVDDEREVRALLRELLSGQGHTVWEAGNGQEGLALARKHKPDAIICDGLMPIMDGFQLLQALKQDTELSSVPFLFHSAVYTGEREQDLAHSLGAQAFLIKPQPAKAILDALREATSGQGPVDRRSPPATGTDMEFSSEYARLAATTLEGKVRELLNASGEWRATFDAMSEAVALLDADGRILRCNKAMAALVNKQFSELIGRPCWEVVHQASGPVDGCPHEAMKKTRKREALVSQFGERWIEATAEPFFDAAGNLVGAIHIMSDITERRHAETLINKVVQQQKAILNNIPDIAWLKDNEGRFLAVNEPFGRACGLSPADLVGKTDLDIWPRELAERYRTDDREVMLSGKRKVVEEPLADNEGKILWIETIKTPIYGQNGDVIGTTGIARDITERKRAEELLRKREEQLAESQRIAGIGSWERDLATNDVMWSKELFRVLGLDPSETAPDFETFLGLVHPGDREGLIRTVSEAIQEKKPYSSVFRIEKPDGKTALLHSQGEVVCDEAGRPVLLRGTAKDITESRRREAALRASEERYRLLFQHSPVGIFQYDTALRITDCNEQFADILRFSAEKLIGFDMRALRDQRVMPSIQRAANGMNGAYEGPYEYPTRTGSTTIAISMRTAPLFDSSGSVIGGIGIVEDISHRKAAEQKLREQQHFTENLIMNSAIATFVVDASHKVLIWNKACEQLTGIPSADMVGTNGQWKAFYDHERPVLADIVLGQEPEHLPSLYETFSQSTLTQEGIQAEGWFAPLNGSARYIVFDAAPVRDDSGAIIAAIETLQDITDRKRAEESVRESEERYRTVIENAFDLIQSVTPDGRFLYVNPAWMRAMKYSLEDLRDRTIFDIIHPSCESKCTRVFNSVAAGVSIERFETQFVAKDGKVIDIEGSATSSMVDGKVVSIQCLLHDITERKKLEEQIYRAKQDWEYTFNSITDMVTVHDADYNIILANKAAEKILKLPLLEKMKDRKCFAYYHGTDHAPEGCPSCGCLQTGVAAAFELFEPHLGMFIEIRAIPRFDSAGDLIGLIHVVRDITERKKSEEAQAAYSKELAALNTASNNLMLITNLRDIYQRICDIIYGVFELKMVWLGVINDHSFEVEPVAYCGQEEGYLSRIKVSWDDSPHGMGPTGKAIKTRTTIKANIHDPMFAAWKSNAESRGYVASMAVPIIYARDKCIGALNFYSDNIDYFTADRMKLCQIFANQAAIAIENARLVEGLEDMVQDRTKALEDANLELQTVNKELVLRREEADAASRSKTDFLANMSHELRTPLNAIMGFSEIMLMGMAGPVSDKQKEFLGDISKSGNHLLSLINDILDLSKVEAGRLELEPETIKLEELVTGSLMMFKEKALKHAIEVKVDIDPTIPDFIGDRRKLKQVLVNLLSNAFKFTPDGGSVRVSAKPIRNSEFEIPNEDETTILQSAFAIPHLEISVADTGMGISKEHQQKLFQPFQQIDSSLTRKYAGTGLGLSLCRRFVELHGGRIWVESEPGKGSTFRFVIPIKRAAAK